MDDRERLKLCFARHIWKIKNELAPLKEKINEVTRYCTWAEVFKIRYGQTLDEYRAEKRG